jgi:hypothetical protein
MKARRWYVVALFGLLIGSRVTLAEGDDDGPDLSRQLRWPAKPFVGAFDAEKTGNGTYVVKGPLGVRQPLRSNGDGTYSKYGEFQVDSGLPCLDRFIRVGHSLLTRRRSR